MGKNDIVAGIRLEGEKKFKEDLTSVNKSLAATKSEMALVSAECAGQENTLESLSKKHEVLNKVLQEQRKKVEATKAGLQHAKESYDNVGKGLESLWVDMEKATDKMKDLEITYGASSKEALEQRKAVQQLNEAIEKGEKNWKTAGNRVKDWETKLNTAEAQVLQANKALNKNAAYMKEAETATDHCAASIDKFGKEISKVKTDTFADDLKANLVTSGMEKGLELAAAALQEVKESMYDVSSASADLAAKTGLSETAMKKYNEVMREIKGNNFGEDYSDISEVMAEIVQIMGELDPSSMQEMTESAITLRDTFGMDVNEQIRAADVMMKSLGIDASQAFDLIATGAQRGLNRSGELTDNLTEYSALWGQAGFSAEEMFAILENGLNSGAYNLDKVNDYVKEFGISLSDGRIEENISSFSDRTASLFDAWENGEATTKDVFYSVISDLSEMTNQQEALTLASTVWSAVGEDNAMQVLTALDDVNDAYNDVKGSMESLKEVKYSDLQSAITGLGASIEENLFTPIADKMLPTVTGLFEKATDIIDGIGEAITPQKSELELFIDDIEAANEEIQTVLNHAQETINGAQADTATLEAYKQTLLELNEQESLTEFQKYQLAGAVNELAGQMPELAKAFDSTTSSLNLTNEELVAMFENAEALAMQEALIKAQTESYEALADAALNVARSDSAVSHAAEEVNKLRDSMIEAAEAGTISMMQQDSYSASLKEAEETLRSAEQQQKEANKAYAAAEEQIAFEEEALKGLREQYDLTTEATEKVVEATEVVADAKGEEARVFDEYGNDITNMSVEEAEAVAEASQKIIDSYNDVHQGIRDAIKGSISLFDEFSGGAEVTAGDINKNLESQITGIEKWSENMATLAGQIGQGFSQELYDELAAMGPEQSATAVQALVDALNSESGEFEKVSENWSSLLALQDNAEAIADATSAGKKIVGSIVTGMEEESSQVTTTTEEITKEVVSALENEVPNIQTAGNISVDAYIKALSAAKAKAAQEGGTLASAARNALASYQNSFHNTGYNMSAGVASGIYAGQSRAVQAAANMARSALKAAKDELEIRSPSRKFRKEVGQNISESTAFGINDKASLAGKAAASMSNKVYTKAVSWLSKYKKSHKVSLEDEKYYWQQVVDHTKKGTSAYNKAINKLAKVTFRNTGLSSDAATGAIKQIESNFGVSRKSNGKKKDTETYYSEIYSAAEKYLSNQQILNDWSLQQELAYWNSVKSGLKKGTQAWYDATAEINSLQNQIVENETRAAEEKLKEHVNVTDDILDKYKVYYKVSAKAEAEYWNIVRKQFKTGTDERINADKKYYEALQESYDRRRELDEEYATDSQKINEKLAESVRDLQETYHEAVKSRKQDILSSMNLFESWDATGYDADTLLYNLKTQVAGLALWEEQLEELGKKGISDVLMEELAAMGPDAAANIYSLNQMTAEQLDEYNKLWEQKNALALSQAVKDNESLLQETNSEIADLKEDAQAELDALNADYLASLQELNTGISSELKNIVKKAATIGEDAVSGLIASIGNAATSVEAYKSTTKVVDSITAQLDALKQEGRIIGSDTLSSILDSLTDQTKITVAAQTAAQSIKRAMQEELVARQGAMQELNMIGSGGITMLNNMTEQYGGIQNTVNVDNSGLLAAMNQVSAGLQALITLVANSKMVMDTGVVAAELQQILSEEDAAAAIRINRGKL